MPTLADAPTTRFAAPRETIAAAPAEARGLARDAVRMLVARPGGVTHRRFRDLSAELASGDLVVVNNSATVAAETDAVRESGEPVVVHVASRLPDRTWVVEVRTAPDADRSILDARPGERLMAGAVSLVLAAPYPATGSSPSGAGNRLWRAWATGDLRGWLDRHGRPIAYGYLDRHYPLSSYQTVFGTRPGSVEMPSAARPFTDGVVRRLASTGVGVAPVTLHTGLSSQEAGEAPQAEWFAVPPTTARLVNTVRARGGRVVAVGTTVTRALESAVLPDATVTARQGWTDRVISPADPARIVSGLVTGWHDPHASHLLLVESVAGAELTQRAYDAAVREGYLWHEFGDSALLLPALPGPVS
ncbi:MAG: S-adenosylmethionine:tRNA ribosyltransferase-isomerase [Actinomycetota bacterium]|nr:S-adenosylmethionine:tRNA ribosyltransferase-isomerase [Actinomycetota bacterium]